MRRIAILWCLASAAIAAPDGAAIYRELCASCHGKNGEGVADEYDEPLYGKKSIMALAKYIDREMPEDEEEKCNAEQSQAVAEWIHGAFYSPEARAKLNPPRVELARLTNEQYRQSVADLVASFGGKPQRFESGGLQAEGEADRADRWRCADRSGGDGCDSESQAGFVFRNMDRFVVRNRHRRLRLPRRDGKRSAGFPQRRARWQRPRGSGGD
jgi:antitoxin component HigA of HigAB toxin-antitoxin module